MKHVNEIQIKKTQKNSLKNGLPQKTHTKKVKYLNKENTLTPKKKTREINKWINCECKTLKWQKEKAEKTIIFQIFF